MRRLLNHALVLLSALFAACARYSSETHAAAPDTAAVVTPPPARRVVRTTGTVYAVKAHTVLVPQLFGKGGRMTLTRLVPNGAKVAQGDVIAEFDRTEQEDAARDAKARYDDLGHQIEQRLAQNRSEAEKRGADLQKAEADLAKAKLQLSKGPLLSEIDRLKAETRAADAEARVASLQRSNQHHERIAAAALRILELQRDRHKVNLERWLKNLDKMVVRAPLAGMIAHESVWRNGSMGHAQEGDQLWNNMPLMRIFDPSEMEIRMRVAEPDGGFLAPGTQAHVRLDAYPDLEFHAVFHAASPVAASALGSPVKTFEARFRLLETDPHLLPDLSAGVIIDREAKL